VERPRWRINKKNLKEFSIKSKTPVNISPLNKLIHKSVLVVIGNSFRYLFTELFKVQNGGSSGQGTFFCVWHQQTSRLMLCREIVAVYS
jgi:hypothetical protein